MTLLILFGVLAIGVSFLCSLLEAVLLSVPRNYIESLVERSPGPGGMLKQMKEHIDRPLAAILTLNTIAHTVGAAGVGAQAAVVWGSNAVGIASAVMTLLILVFSEIIPKTLGAVHVKTLAIPAAFTIKLMIWLCLPLIIPLEWVNRLIGYQRHEDRLSRAELWATIRLGRHSGALERREYKIVSNLMALDKILLKDVLTPRTVLFSLPEQTTVQQAIDEYYPIRFARIPVYRENRDHIVGYVPRFELHAAHSDGRADRTLGQLARPIKILPELTSAASALDQFIADREHIAVVVDEYGSTLGIITLEDLYETLLGEEIIDETDTVEDMQKLAHRVRNQRRRDVAT